MKKSSIPLSIKIDPDDKQKEKDIKKALKLFAKHGYEITIKPKRMEQLTFLNGLMNMKA